MEWANIIINAIIASGIIGTLVHYKSKNRKQVAEADKTETEADVAAFDSLEEKIAFLDNQLIDSFEQRERLQTLLNEERETNIKLRQEKADLKVEQMAEREKRITAEWNMCIVDNCKNRQPKRTK